MRTLFVGIVAALALAAVNRAQIAAAADDPVVGTWKMDAAKSVFKSGPVLKSQTRTYSQSGDKISLEIKTVGADGKEMTSNTTYELNGKNFPVTGSPDYDAVSGKRLNPNTAVFTLKKGGKPVGHSRRIVSKDGKKLTSHQNLTTASGEKTESTLRFDRQ